MRKKKEKKESKGGEKKYQPLNDFKIALSAMLLDEDFKMLESHSKPSCVHVLADLHGTHGWSHHGSPANAAPLPSLDSQDMEDSGMTAHQMVYVPHHCLVFMDLSPGICQISPASL
eukprot:6860219-Ditylum_brightwellii.AAC.1